MEKHQLDYYDGGGSRALQVLKDGAAVTRVRLWFGPLEVWYQPNGAADKKWAHLAHGGPLARVPLDAVAPEPLLQCTDPEGGFYECGIVTPDPARAGRLIEMQFHNQLGHLLVALDPYGEAVGGFQYGAFGEILAQVGSPNEHLRRFNGKEFDMTTGLSYYGYRHYDPLSMMWTQADPLFRFAPDIAFDQPRKLNLYTFSLNNPTRYVDPDGRQTKEAGLVVNVCKKNPAACVLAAGIVAVANLLRDKPDFHIDGTVDDAAYDVARERDAAARRQPMSRTMSSIAGGLAIGVHQAKKNEDATEDSSENVPDANAAEQAGEGVKLTKGGTRAIGNLADLKDTPAADAIRDRGGTASNVNEALGDGLRDKTVGEIANLAAQKDKAAVKALKIIKQAKKKGQRLD